MTWLTLFAGIEAINVWGNYIKKCPVFRLDSKFLNFVTKNHCKTVFYLELVYKSILIANI
jgi:hypothetical protein